MFRTVPLSIIRNLALYTQHNLHAIYLILLMMDRETVRNMYSSIPKIRLRN